jgi:hypothetical protein
MGGAITTGMGTIDYLGNTFSQLSKQNPKPPEPRHGVQNTGVRKIPSALSQKINYF